MPSSSLHLLHLSSPALPIGAYAYSQGLEYAIEAGWLDNEGLANWLHDGLQLGIARLDLPLLLRALTATLGNDGAALDACNERLLANRETAELLLEDQQIGQALWRLLNSLGSEPLPTLTQKPGYAIAFALACARWKIEAPAALEAFSYSWLENQVTAATKLVPLGQTEAQRLLLELLDAVPEACATAQALDDEQIGLSLPGLVTASCRHERQHTRLFRS